MENYSTFWQNYSRICKERGFSPSYVAIQCGFSTSAVCRWKSSRKPQSDTIVKLSNFLGVPPESFFADPTLPSTTAPNKNTVKLSFEDGLVEAFKALPVETKAKLLTIYLEQLYK